MKRLRNETIVDINEEVEKHDIVYGLTLGDLVFDTFNLFGDVKDAFLSTNITFFHTIGNHDFDGTDLINTATAAYRKHYGPLDFSFNRGDVHFVVMNNVFNYTVPRHDWGFSKEQLEWLRQDLAHVPREKMLVLSVHIPVIPSTSMARKKEFMNLISGFSETHILSGHWHAHRNYIDKDLNIYEHLTGAASGAWWNGTANHCGAPNGYSVFNIEDNRMKNWYYKSTRHNDEYQIRMLLPYTFGDTEGLVVANVWNADNNWKIELLEDGISSGEMIRYTDYAPEMYEWNVGFKRPISSNWYHKTNHLYKKEPKNPDSILSIKATDRFGNTFYQDTPTNDVSSISKY